MHPFRADLAHCEFKIRRIDMPNNVITPVSQDLIERAYPSFFDTSGGFQ
jgi:hypothetical protein